MAPYPHLLLVLLASFHAYTEGSTTSSFVNDTVTTISPFAVRLVNGTNNSSGRVEVFHDGQWGTVCSDGWGNDDAQVVCRMIGFNNAKHVGSAFFGAGSGPIWMDEVKCDGSEQSLDECQFNGWGNQNCNHGRDAGVICFTAEAATPVDFRLVDKLNNFTGRIEVYFGGYWGSICSQNSNVNHNYATAACRSLDYSDGAALRINLPPNEPIWMDGVRCNGSESSLAECQFFGWGSVGHCEHQSRVKCFNQSAATPVDFRLVDKLNNFTGRIEVYFGGYWGSICSQNSNVNHNYAKAACRSLDYSDGAALRINLPPNEPIWMDGVRCNGSESSLAECQFFGWGSVGHCEHQSRVKCFNQSAATPVDFRLVDKLNNFTGRIEVYFGGYWGSICSQNSNVNHNYAKAACRSLDYSDGAALRINLPPNEPIWMDGVRCNGSESSLAECQFFGWGSVGHCEHQSRVKCFNQSAATPVDFRLVDKLNNFTGRIEVYFGGYWGSICSQNSNVNHNYAKAACRSLDYSDGAALRINLPPNEPIWMDGVRCNGSESSLAECQFFGWGSVGHCEHQSRVKCFNQSAATPVDFRLVDKLNNFTGRIEVYFGGYWGSICSQNSNVNHNYAKAACRSLDYSDGAALRINLPPNEPIWMDGVRCNGSESSLAECQFFGWGSVGHCEHQSRVKCFNQSAATPVDFRLVDKLNNFTGRIEVYFGGYWGSICSQNSNVNHNYAKAACRSLDYSDGAALRINLPPNEPIWMDGVRCNGSESSLAECQFFGWGSVGHCEHQSRVKCFNQSAATPVDFRLVDKLNNFTGRIEVYFGGYWGSICSQNSNVNHNYAKAACRSLDYSDGAALRINLPPNEPIWMDGVRCSGSESSLAECQFFGWGSVGHCEHQSRVKCFNQSAATPVDFRLVDKLNNFTGRIEVYFGGYWGSICSQNSNVNHNYAKAACRSLDYSDGAALRINLPPNEPIWMDGVRCSGSESSLAECQFFGWGSVGHCEHQSRVKCFNQSAATPVDFRLVDKLNNFTGRIEVYFGGYWGSICSQNSNVNHNYAKAACRSLDYSDGAALRINLPPNEPIWMDGVRCNGSESSLAECQFFGWGSVGHCEHQSRVKCFNQSAATPVDFRLVDKLNNFTGRIEVYFGGYWGSICSQNSNVNHNYATVACRSLGYSDGTALRINLPPNEPIWMDGVRCYGSESSLAECQFFGWGNVGHCEHQSRVKCFNLPGNLVDVDKT